MRRLDYARAMSATRSPASEIRTGAERTLHLLEQQVGRSLSDVETPVAVIDLDRLGANLRDLQSYVETQGRVDEEYLQRDAWLRKSLVNIARMGKFSSDRTIREYARDIWNIKPPVIGSFAHAMLGE